MTFLLFFFFWTCNQSQIWLFITKIEKKKGGRSGGRAAGFEAAEHQWKQLPRKEPLLFNQTFNTRKNKDMDIDKTSIPPSYANELAT